MKLLNTLCAIYLAAASSYTIAVVLDRNPGLRIALVETGAAALHEGKSAAVAVNAHVLQPGWVVIAQQMAGAYGAVKEAMNTPPPVPARSVPPRSVPPKTAPAKSRVVIAKAPEQLAAAPSPAAPKPSAPNTDAPAEIAQFTKPRVERLAKAMDLRPQTLPAPVERMAGALPVIPPPPPQAEHPVSASDLALVQERLKGGLTTELFANFSLFIYVSKAQKGPVAQRMYVYDKGAGETLSLLYDWPVSTGKEATVANPRGQLLGTHTPAGYYEFDPHRIFRHYTSHQWGVPMPYAMFFNWVRDGDLTGLAIHSAYGDDEIKALGNRASSGCVRLSPANAQTLFELVRTRYEGDEPVFASNRRTGDTSNRGELAHDAAGNLRFVHGYKVLVVIEDFGGKEIVAIM